MKPEPLPVRAADQTAPQFTISLVEDEPVLREEMAFQLAHNGFVVESFESAAEFYRHLAVQPNTIAVLDIGLPGEDGLSICKHLRQHNAQIGIVFLTARGNRESRLAGLELGADAYLVKPVDMDELVLVLKRLAMRFKTTAPSWSQLPNSGFANNQWQLEAGASFIMAPNGIRVRLSVNESQVIRAMLLKAGEACGHTELALAMGLLPDEFNKHRAEVIVSRLRGKVERECGLRLPIQSVRGVGYQINK